MESKKVLEVGDLPHKQVGDARLTPKIDGRLKHVPHTFLYL